MQERDGEDQLPASNVFIDPEIETLEALSPTHLKARPSGRRTSTRWHASPPAFARAGFGRLGSSPGWEAETTITRRQGRSPSDAAWSSSIRSTGAGNWKLIQKRKVGIPQRFREGRLVCTSTPSYCPASPDRGRAGAAPRSGTAASVVSPAFAGAGSGSPAHAARRRRSRSAHSILRRSSLPSPFGWRRTGRPALRLCGAHQGGAGAPVLRTTICSRIAAPLYRGADLRMSRATFPWRLLFAGCREEANRYRAASGKRRESETFPTPTLQMRIP